MITVTISGDRREGNYSESWVTEQVVRPRADRQNPWVTVEIRTPSVNMTLATPGCGGPGGYRRPNDSERRIFDLWARSGMDSVNFSPANLMSFLSRASGFL
jgi:hypothetical protein